MLGRYYENKQQRHGTFKRGSSNLLVTTPTVSGQLFFNVRRHGVDSANTGKINVRNTNYSVNVLKNSVVRHQPQTDVYISLGSFETNNGFVVPRKMNFQEAVANGTERTVQNRDTFLSSRTP